MVLPCKWWCYHQNAVFVTIGNDTLCNQECVFLFFLTWRLCFFSINKWIGNNINWRSIKIHGSTSGNCGWKFKPGELVGYITPRLYLVGALEHEFYDFPYIGNNHHPNWFIFFRGVGFKPTTTYIYIYMYSMTSNYITHRIHVCYIC